jgi:protoheme IX farnesyltransferase
MSRRDDEEVGKRPAALALGAALVDGTVRLLRGEERTWARRLFLFSNVYLALLFLAMIVDGVLIRGGAGGVP